MARVITIRDPYTLAQANTLRDTKAPSKELKKAMYRVGSEVGKTIVETFCLCTKTVVTPMQYEIDCTVADIPTSAVITTKDDMQYFGKGVIDVLGSCTRGWMDFQGRRGLQALQSPLREIEFPDPKESSARFLIIGKSVLATGCTAISLTRAALSHFVPEKLIIVSIFYSQAGLTELEHVFPHASLFVVGEPDLLTEDGLLVPGIGLLDKRLHS